MATYGRRNQEPDFVPVISLDLDAIRQRAEAATEGPWWFDEDDNCWRLHGVHARMPVTLGGVVTDQVINHQILKAPKRGTTYAEYWPNEADAAFIRHSREDIPALLAEVNRLTRALAAVESLTKDTDGGDVDSDAEIPVGEIRRMLAEETP